MGALGLRSGRKPSQCALRRLSTHLRERHRPRGRWWSLDGWAAGSCGGIASVAQASGLRRAACASRRLALHSRCAPTICPWRSSAPGGSSSCRRRGRRRYGTSESEDAMRNGELFGSCRGFSTASLISRSLPGLSRRNIQPRRPPMILTPPTSSASRTARLAAAVGSAALQNPGANRVRRT